MSFGSGASVTFRPAMIFIDGGYLRRNLRELFEHDWIEYSDLARNIADFWGYGSMRSELVRAYYYDAQIHPPDKSNERYVENEKYFDEIRKLDSYDVRLARLKESSKEGRKQKGVDTLLAVDMLTKAFLNHYDVAYLLAGDDDFTDLVQNVKMFTGKRVYGVYFTKHISQDLLNSFDYKTNLDVQKYHLLKRLMEYK